MAKQKTIKEELGEEANVASISKRSAEMWKNLSSQERTHWDEIARKDKERYLEEKAKYSGPWQVPYQRQKKNPAAPKRPMSAFLFFSLGLRSKLKEENPDMKNTDISRLLGEMWRNLPPEEREPHVQKEKSEREKYKIAMAAWKSENEAKEAAAREAATAQMQQQPSHNPFDAYASHAMPIAFPPGIPAPQFVVPPGYPYRKSSGPCRFRSRASSNT